MTATKVVTSAPISRPDPPFPKPSICASDFVALEPLGAGPPVVAEAEPVAEADIDIDVEEPLSDGIAVAVAGMDESAGSAV